jgi:hypothetical protein
MKMAKPSAQDVKAAEELLHVLQLIAAWGGPWPNPAAGENLCELLNNGETAFDYANTTHLQTLYNNLARLQRTACPARVISGMCHVIMYEKNEILDPESDCIDLHPRFAQAQAQIEQLQAECQTLSAQQATAPQAAKNDHDLSHWSESLKSTWPVEPLDPEGAWMIGSIDNHGDGDQTHWPVVTVEADQYDAPGDSEKIAKALSALWQQAFANQAPDAGGTL